jgi:hypothetical protein
MGRDGSAATLVVVCLVAVTPILRCNPRSRSDRPAVQTSTLKPSYPWLHAQPRSDRKVACQSPSSCRTPRVANCSPVIDRRIPTPLKLNPPPTCRRWNVAEFEPKKNADRLQARPQECRIDDTSRPHSPSRLRRARPVALRMVALRDVRRVAGQSFCGATRPRRPHVLGRLLC